MAADTVTTAEYTSEELDQIRELTDFFSKAPGQVAIPDIPVATGDSGLQEEDFSPDDFDPDLEGTDNEPVRTGPPKASLSLDDDLGDFGDLDGLDIASDSATGDQDFSIPELPDDFSVPQPEAVSLDFAADSDDPFTAPPAQDIGFPDSNETGGAGDFPDLDFPAAAADSIPDAGSSEFPDLQLSDLSSAAPEKDFSPPTADFPAIDDFGAGDLGSLDDTAAFDLQPPSLDELSPSVALSSAPPSSLSDDLQSLAMESAPDDLSDSEIAELHARLRTFPTPVRKAVIESIVQDRLTVAESKNLVARIREGATPDEISEYLKSKKLRIAESETSAAGRVIVSRPGYSESGLYRQKQMLRFTRIAALLILGIGLVGGSLWQLVLKPMFYRGIVAEGKELILSGKPDSARKAEDLFKRALDYYPTRSYAFLQYADAYRRTQNYESAFEKLFGKVRLAGSNVRYKDAEISDARSFWPLLQKVPVIRYDGKPGMLIAMNELRFEVQQKGIYLIRHLDEGSPEAAVLIALGEFHSNPAKRFSRNYLRNNLLGIDYFQRVLNFDADTPAFQKDKFLTNAIMGIGNVYYYQGEYTKALDYFERITRNDPYSAGGQAGVIRTLIKLFRTSGDPRLVIQQHSVVKHQLNLEEQLPLHVMTRLAAFYIDLPADDELRIKYNVSPTDNVNGKLLKSRASELLDLSFRTDEEDAYGNVTQGRSFAEGYYQRGRYYQHVLRQNRMAMQQYEYAFKYDPRHFLALSDRAELLLDLKDYAGALEHLRLAARKIQPAELDLLGDRPEDETLLEAGTGKIPFLTGKAMYLDLARDLGTTESWVRLQEIQKFRSAEDYGASGLMSQLDLIDGYFSEAEATGLREKHQIAELRYFQGWASYARGNFRNALGYWEKLPDDWQVRSANLELARSHARYKLAMDPEQDTQTHLESALGSLLYLENLYGNRVRDIRKPIPDSKLHIALYSRLAIIENNLGAVYERMGEEETSLQHYWRSIEHSKKINRENEIAQLNIRLNFKRSGLANQERYPLIMDFVSPEFEDNLSGDT